MADDENLWNGKGDNDRQELDGRWSERTTQLRSPELCEAVLDRPEREKVTLCYL